MTYSSRIIVFIALLLVSPWVKGASIYEPGLEWQTVKTENFNVHYPESAYRNMAVRIARIAEGALVRLTELLVFKPEGVIDIVLSDAYDGANGSAQVMPRNTIRLYLAAPVETTGLSDYADWLEILVTHELAHICDLDQSYGVTRWLRYVFGKYVSMNTYTPQFLSEGLAVYAETMLSDTGRGRSSYVKMLLRMAALEDRFLEIDQAHIQFSDWPGPNAAYFYGGTFHLWLAKKFGRGAVAALHKKNAAMPIPYFYYPTSKAIFGQGLVGLWKDWRLEVLAEAIRQRERVIKGGMTSSRAITNHGRNITGARYSPTGDYIIYSRTSPKDGSTVRRVNLDGSDDRFVVLQTFSPRFAFSSDGEYLFYSQNANNNRFNNYSDLYRFHVPTGRIDRLREKGNSGVSLRARDPSLSPDGTKIVFVQGRLHQTWLSVGRFDDGWDSRIKVSQLVAPHGDMQFASPQFSPDGTKIAVSVWVPGGYRDIWLLDSKTGKILRRISGDRAVDANPVWSPDGGYILFESDRTGIFNIYSYALDTGRYFQITNLVGGGFQPHVHPEGGVLLFRNASATGFDIHEIPFEPAQWKDVGSEFGFEYQLEEDFVRGDTVVSKPRKDERDLVLKEDELIEAYDLFESLLPFNDNWVLLPAIYTLNEDITLKLKTFGRDVLGEHSYALSVSSSLQTPSISWHASYANNVLYPTFSLAVGDGWTVYPLDAGKLVEHRTTLSGGIRWPVRLRHYFSMQYHFERRESDNNASPSKWLALGDFGWLEAGYSYRLALRFPHSVSAEYGRALSAAFRFYSPWLGAELNQVLFTSDARYYWNSPWFVNHVVAIRGVLSVSLGPDEKEKFYLGGQQGTSFLSAQTGNFYPLRGFSRTSRKATIGTGLWATYFEYRFPLLHVERGLWTLPVYMERFHGALFVDAGNTFEEISGKWFDPRVGVGAELRVDLSLGWAIPLTIRGAIAWPFYENGRFNTGYVEGIKPDYFIGVGSQL